MHYDIGYKRMGSVAIKLALIVAVDTFDSEIDA